MKNKKNIELANYLFSILKSNRMVMFSWGFNSPSVIENGLMFKVEGFLHQGTVRVVLDEGKDLFEIQLISNKNELIKTIEDVYFDQLVGVIDSNVERVSNYDEVVKNTYRYDSSNSVEKNN